MPLEWPSKPMARSAWASAARENERGKERERDQQLGTTRGWACMGRWAVAPMPSSALGLLSPPCSPASSLHHPAILIFKASCLVCPSVYQHHHTPHILVLCRTSCTACGIDRLLAITSSCSRRLPGSRPRTSPCLDHADPHHTQNGLLYALSVSLPTLPQPTRNMTSGTAVLRRNPETRCHPAEVAQAPITTGACAANRLHLGALLPRLCHRPARSKSIV